MSSSAAPRRTAAPPADTLAGRRATTATDPVRRGLSVVLDVPADGPDTAELFGLADILHELALDLVPGSTARTSVTLGPVPTTGGRP
ncbi:MAG TPA: hypothetical protein VN257_07920 [Actinotalea sp.]|nr:hypothetical protein [Actinotalea sp.]